jgi:hypothetical protein
MANVKLCTHLALRKTSLQKTYGSRGFLYCQMPSHRNHIYSAKKVKDHIFSEVLKSSSLYLKVVLLLIWDSIHQYSILSSTPFCVYIAYVTLSLHCIDIDFGVHSSNRHPLMSLSQITVRFNGILKSVSFPKSQIFGRFIS